MGEANLLSFLSSLLSEKGSQTTHPIATLAKSPGQGLIASSLLATMPQVVNDHDYRFLCKKGLLLQYIIPASTSQLGVY
jgi:hypothetical protein